MKSNPLRPTVDDFLIIAYLLKKAEEEGQGLTPLQINKLVYICHGWALGMLDRPLIDNQSGQIQAWKYGPVVRNVYDYLKHWGSQKITYNSLFDYFGTGVENVVSQKLADLERNDPELWKLLHVVWYVYGGIDGGQLIALTHQKGTPWDLEVKRNFWGQVVREVPIPDSTILRYYKEDLKDLPDLPTSVNAG